MEVKVKEERGGMGVNVGSISHGHASYLLLEDVPRALAFREASRL